MMKENNDEKYLYNSATLNNIRSEYKEVLIDSQIRKEDFEQGVQWLYKNLLHRPKPQIRYCNGLDVDVIRDVKSKKINRLTVENALNRCIDSCIRGKNKWIDDLLLKRVLSEHLHLSHQHTVQDIINGYGKNGINLKEHLARIAYLDFHIRLDDVVFPDFSYLKKLFCSGVYYIFFWEDFVLVLPNPVIREDEHGQLHSTVYPAIEWPQGGKVYYIHGREMPEWIFQYYGTDSLYQRFLAEDNEDIRSGIITLVNERIGDKGLLDFLKAELVDEKEVVHHSGYTEVLRLYKSKEKFDYLQDRKGKSGQPYCWSEFTCPSTGATYLIDNSADFKNAIEAAKFLRPSFVPEYLPYRWSHDAS